MYLYLISTYSALLLTPQGVMYTTRRMHSKFSYTHLVLSLHLQLGLCVVIFLCSSGPRLPSWRISSVSPPSPLTAIFKPLSLVSSVSRSLEHFFFFLLNMAYFVF